MGLIEDADRTAAEAHAGQTRRHGAPYIDHPRAVARLVDDLAFACGLTIDDEVRAAALLHDVAEDSPSHSVDVIRAKFNDNIASAVGFLTKSGKGKEAAAAYYEKLTKEAAATTKLIKVCDRLHNLSELHKAASEKKLHEYVEETRTFVKPLAAQTHVGLLAAVDDAIDNALANQGASAFVPPRGLYAIVAPGEAWKERLKALLDGGVARVQLRVKDAKNDRAWLALITEAVSICRARRVHLVVNDRVDLARAGHADGVHVGDTDLPAKLAREIVGGEFLVGTSTHTVAQLREEDVAGHADHLAFGPVWESSTKSGHADVVGLDALKQACASTSKPVVAIGGITTPQRAAEAARAGASFVAAVSALHLPDRDSVHAMARRFALSFAAARASR